MTRNLKMKTEYLFCLETKQDVNRRAKFLETKKNGLNSCSMQLASLQVCPSKTLSTKKLNENNSIKLQNKSLSAELFNLSTFSSASETFSKVFNFLSSLFLSPHYLGGKKNSVLLSTLSTKCLYPAFHPTPT